MNLTLQKGIDPITGEIIWLLLDGDYQVVEPVQRYLTFLSGQKSPCTVEAYGYDLKAWWEFLDVKHLDWRNVSVNDLGDFVYWSRVGDLSNVVSMQPVKAKKCESTINRAISTIRGFYEYHQACKTVDSKKFERLFMPQGVGSKGLLDGIAKTKPRQEKLIKLKEPKKFCGCLTNEEVVLLVEACSWLRDKFIICALNETGMRKGEIFGLRHEDIDEKNKLIKVVKRNNPNGARAKGQERVIPVGTDLLRMYTNYLIHEYPEVEADYVFINIWGGDGGMPMNPRVLNTMFSRLSKKTGIEKLYPHLFRHTYASRLLRAGYPVERVAYLLGHRSVMTTLDIYSHIIEEGKKDEVVEREKQENEFK